MDNKSINELEFIVPVTLEQDWATAESITESIMYLYNEYGFTRFAINGPTGGWRSKHFPPIEHYEMLGRRFAEVRKAVALYGIECGWWIASTMKSGPSEEFTRMTNHDGTVSAIASCPLDPVFREHYSDSIVAFAKIAKPAFMITEDDYSIYASVKEYGCFCKNHMDEFSKRTGVSYTPGQLVEIFRSNTPERDALLKKWRELMKDSLVGFADAVREKLDRCLPEIPVGTCETGNCDIDGATTEPLARALAGEKHIPFSRIHGAYYCGGDTKEIPYMLYHAIYEKQHIKGNFKFIHETDTFPHTRFYSSAKQIKVMLSIVISHGFDGSLFHTQQLLDNANEERTFGKMYAKEIKKFNAVHRYAAQCRQHGVGAYYDPYYNTSDSEFRAGMVPMWVKALSYFGIPYTTTEAEVVFADPITVKSMSDDEILKLLSGGVFLDGDAARILCDRGFSEYIGVSVGRCITEDSRLVYDLGAREVICDEFIPQSRGRNMPSAHMYCPKGNGRLLPLTVTEDSCEVISNIYNFEKKHVAVSMTRFENRLGGRVVVMGETLDGNNSQSLFNYRRQLLVQELLKWCTDGYPFVCGDPAVYMVENRATDPDGSGFFGMLTLINLCEDDLDKLTLHLPDDWKSVKEFKTLDAAGNTCDVKTVRTEDSVELYTDFRYSEPVYIIGI